MISTVQLEDGIGGGGREGVGENKDDKMIEGGFKMGKKARMYL